MTNLRTILEELETDIRAYALDGGTNAKERKVSVEKALAKIEGMMPEKKSLKGLRNSTHGRGTAYKQAQGYNQAIEDMKANLGGKK